MVGAQSVDSDQLGDLAAVNVATQGLSGVSAGERQAADTHAASIAAR